MFWYFLVYKEFESSTHPSSSHHHHFIDKIIGSDFFLYKDKMILIKKDYMVLITSWKIKGKEATQSFETKQIYLQGWD